VAGLAMPCVENKPKEYPQQPEKKRLPNTQWVKYVYCPVQKTAMSQITKE
jgi:hypothetical protein